MSLLGWHNVKARSVKRFTKKKCYITEILAVSRVKITSGPCLGFSWGVMSVLCFEMMSKVPGLSKK